jgi:hypothetical protein
MSFQRTALTPTDAKGDHHGNIAYPLRLTKHLSIATTKLAQHSERYSTDVVLRIAQSSPQGLKNGKNIKCTFYAKSIHR